jgi:hypothetical protein
MTIRGSMEEANQVMYDAIRAWQRAYREYLRLEGTLQVFTAEEKRAACEGLLKAQNDLMEI